MADLDARDNNYYDKTGRLIDPQPVFMAGGASGQIMARPVYTMNGTTDAGAKQIVAEDDQRKGLTVRNDSDAQMYMRTDGEASDGVGYPLDARRGYSFESSGMMPDGAISIWCATSGNRWAVLYSTDGDPYA